MSADEEHKEVVNRRCQVFVSRIPSSFVEESVRRLVESNIGEGSVVDVGLKYEEEEDNTKVEEKNDEDERFQREPKKKKAVVHTNKTHKGYAFLQFQTPEQAEAAVKLGQVRGGKKENSSKKRTLYIKAVDKDEEEGGEAATHVCFLWQNHRCPYGDACKFAHEGEGGCFAKKDSGDEGSKKRKRCWDYKKGKCKLGTECSFSHDFEVKKEESTRADRPKSEKDCITWKTKGKCSKGEKCPYRHDESIRNKVLAKKRKGSEKTKDGEPYKRQQPLTVRVFGLNYETKEDDVRELFDGCGKINAITYPAFEDSGRSKGYCEIAFASPKAVSEAAKLNETELHGRWLSVQAGKMYLRQWESQEQGDTKRVRHD